MCDYMVRCFDFDPVKEQPQAITPLPAGVRPMTISCFLKYTLDCFKAH